MFPYCICMGMINILNERCSKIFNKILNNKSPITIEELSNLLDVSSRTIRYDLDNIDNYLKEHDLKILTRKPNKGISFTVPKEEKQKILEYLNWKYPHEEIEGVPTKTSVTKIKEMVNAEQVEEQTKNVKFAVEETKEVRTITQKPKFINNNENAKISNAQKGTLMHLCVQKMNEKEEYTAEKIQELIDGLKKKGIISEAEAENINISKLQGYTKSDLWQELKNAREIHKEKAFYINVKASRMYDISKENDENILVQGIIDLYYIDKDGKLVLVDYKTDYVEAGKESELVEKYKEQLYLYRDALEMALNRKVDRM